MPTKAKDFREMVELPKTCDVVWTCEAKPTAETHVGSLSEFEYWLKEKTGDEENGDLFFIDGPIKIGDGPGYAVAYIKLI